MTITQQLQQLLKDHIVIRHRNDEALPGDAATCIVCRRPMHLPPGSLCLMVDDEGLICPVCGTTYAPEMIRALDGKVPFVNEERQMMVRGTSAVLAEDAATIAEELDALQSKTDMLAKGLARGIIEAPAGHIGLLHYAKDIQKPERRPNESEKDYELRIRSFRMSYLYEKIRTDTTGRVEHLMKLLEKYIH